MTSPSKSFWNNRDARLNLPNKMTTLNPNAAEFVPSAFRSLPGNNKKVDVARLEVPGTSGKALLDQSTANVSDNSDDEAHQYWRHQLPDDITPDFKVMGEELHVPGDLSLGRLSINDGIGTSTLSTRTGSHLLAHLPYTQDHSSTALINSSSNTLDKQFMNGDQHLMNSTEGGNYDGNLNASFLNGLLSKHAVLEDAAVNPVELLALQFPGFAAESLAELYYANGCDFNSTVEMLNQLELKVDNSFNQKMNTKTLRAPSLSELDFPALPVSDSQNGLSKYSGEDLQQSTNAFRSVDNEGFSLFKSIPSGESMGAPVFSSAIRGLASKDSEHWKYKKNGITDASNGPSLGSQLLTSSYNGHGKAAFADRLQGLGTALAAPPWLETGDTMAQMYPEMRGEGNDFALLRNACFEQAKQAYILGNKVLAKELTVKGQLCNIQVKEAHEKARESIYRRSCLRTPAAQLQSYNQAQDPLIDLQGLHVNEAIHVLKHEINILRRTARSAGRRLQVVICVAGGQQTRGSRTSVRLTMAVQQYLLDENLLFSEDQPGLLRVVIC